MKNVPGRYGSDMTMFPKMLVSACALAFIMSVPADAAQSRKHRKHVAARTTVSAAPAYRGTHLFPPGPVMYGSEYLGDDPDPFIRSQIQRDLGAHFGDND
jgi:hypothetical protein